MKESDKLLVNKIIIRTESKEYSIEEIYSDKNLYSLASKTVNFKLLQYWNSDLIEKINIENAILIINTDSKYEKNMLSLANASNELLDEFNNKLKI